MNSLLRIQMLLRGDTQEDLARLLGVNQSNISKRLNGKLKFTEKDKRKLARHYKKTIQELGL